MKRASAAAFLLAASIAVAAPGPPPRQVPYQGVLELNGAPVNTPTTLEFFLVTSESETYANRLWAEVHPSVPISNGRFSVVLGSVTAFPPSIFAHTALYLGTRIGSAELSGKQRLYATPYAIRPVEGVPVGTVIDWWRPNTSTPIPDGYVLCDGSMINDPLSPLNGVATPDLRGRFVRGAGTSAGQVQERETGPGNSQLNVSVTVDNGGGHNHPWANISAGDWYTWDSAGTQTLLVDWGDGMDSNGMNEYPLSVTAPQTRTLYTQGSTGTHGHTASGRVDVAPGSVVPPYYGMLKLMRIR